MREWNTRSRDISVTSIQGRLISVPEKQTNQEQLVKTSLTMTVVTRKIKHLQKCFRAVDFLRLRRGRINVVNCFILHVTTTPIFNM